jgi:hypothetical protein
LYVNRGTYLSQVYQSSGDENLILKKVNDSVGYGVFAAKDFKKGDYIVRYGGELKLAGLNAIIIVEYMTY